MIAKLILFIEKLRQKALELNYVNLDLKNIGEKYISELFSIKNKEKEISKIKSEILIKKKENELRNQKKLFIILEKLFNQALNNSTKVQEEYTKLLEEFIEKLDSQNSDTIQDINIYIIKNMFDLYSSEKKDVSFSKDNTLINFYKNLLNIINNRKKQKLDYKDE